MSVQVEAWSACRSAWGFGWRALAALVAIVVGGLGAASAQPTAPGAMPAVSESPTLLEPLCDPEWATDTFCLPGLDGTVYAMTTWDDGTGEAALLRRTPLRSIGRLFVLWSNAGIGPYRR